MTNPPSTTKRKSVLKTLRDAATKLNERAEEMEELWCEHDSAEKDFEQGTSSERDKALGVGAGR